MSKKIIEDKRISSRRRKLILRKWFTALWIIFVIILFGAIIWGLNFFYNSDYFKIKNIEVKGTDYYKPEEIRESIKNLNGANIFEIDKKKNEDIITNNFSRIKEADLQKIFPDKLVINLSERVPFLVIFYKDNYFLIDDEGVVIEKISEIKEKYKDLLTVKDVVNYMPVLGDKIAKKNIISSAVIYNAFNEEIKASIKYAGVNNDIFSDIFFETFDGKIIIYGNSKEIIKKNTVLEQILKDIKKENIYYSIIDLRISDNPIVK
jgi:cell division protein FtsQ